MKSGAVCGTGEISGSRFTGGAALAGAGIKSCGVPVAVGTLARVCVAVLLVCCGSKPNREAAALAAMEVAVEISAPDMALSPPPII